MQTKATGTTLPPSPPAPSASLMTHFNYETCPVSCATNTSLSLCLALHPFHNLHYLKKKKEKNMKKDSRIRDGRPSGSDALGVFWRVLAHPFLQLSGPFFNPFCHHTTPHPSPSPLLLAHFLFCVAARNVNKLRGRQIIQQKSHKVHQHKSINSFRRI